MSREPRIRVLPALLVNKIAAGEVVERPASVVKELLENALDAGAGRIKVTIEDGGRRLIRVSDDGIGMTPEELQLSVVPHATSKLTDEHDLYAIGTMGFRGEALASISSVSKTCIRSRARDSREGYEIHASGDQVEHSEATGCAPGTTVEVRELFFNVPARRKFLRTVSTETGHINEQFTRIALAHTEVSFELHHNTKTTHQLEGETERRARIGRFFGSELADALITSSRDERGITIEAYAAPPAKSRSSAQWQYTFVNGRYIRDRFIQHAIKESYRGLTEPHRHGVVFLFLTIDPANVDVNVHPTKTEVRWADSNLIHSQVLSILREMFQRADLSPSLRTLSSQPKLDAGEQQRIRHEMAQMLKNQTPLNEWTKGADRHHEYDPSPGNAPAHIGPEPVERLNAPYGQLASDAGSEPLPGGSRSGRAIQLHNLYLVAETEDGIVIIDQHALHERVLYEQFKDRMMSGSLESQRLLLPETVSVTGDQLALIGHHGDLLRKLGIEVDQFGTESVAVHALPALLKDVNAGRFVSDLIDKLSAIPADASGEVVIHEVLDMMACKAAVKAGDPLTDSEVETLINKRHLVEKSSSCPHGRPTMLRLTKADLNRQFHRT